MKDKIFLDTREQMDLITDPMSLSIINTLDSMSKQEVAEQLEEDLKMVSRYIDELEKHGILEKVDEDEEPARYQRVAKTINTKQAVIDEPNHYWVSGMLNHMENDVIDYQKVIEQFDDREEAVNNLGYGDLTISNSTMSMTREEYEEFLEMIRGFNDKLEETKDDEDKRKYSFNMILHPAVVELKKAIKNKKDK